MNCRLYFEIFSVLTIAKFSEQSDGYTHRQIDRQRKRKAGGFASRDKGAASGQASARSDRSNNLKANEKSLEGVCCVPVGL